MIRTALTSIAVSTFAVLAAACSASPGPQESLGTAGQADTVAGDCANAATPLTYAKTVRVYSPPDPEEGLKGGWTTGEICAPATAAPVAPDGGYPDGTITSCTVNNGFVLSEALPPPPLLAGCTAGFQFAAIPDYTVAAFLCPPSVVQSLSLPLDIDGGSFLQTNYFSVPMDDGCFGAPLLPGWTYVEVATSSEPCSCGPSQKFGGIVCSCGFPGPGCGGECTKL